MIGISLSKVLALHVRNLKEVAANLVCRFFCLLLFLFSSASPAGIADKNHFALAITPYSQQVNYKESESGRVYNVEQGTLTGFKYQLSYQFDNWSMDVSGDHSKGTLDYYGRTQLGRKLETNTDIHRDIFKIHFTKPIINFSDYACSSCGELSTFVGAIYEQTYRNILSKGIITGLEEKYEISMGELGLIWELPNFLFVDWMIKVMHSQSFDANLDVNFLSTYNNTNVPLNRVYVNQAELNIRYTVSKDVRLGLMLNYIASKIEKSDKFPLYKQTEQSGIFYQPQREMNGVGVGLMLSVDF